MGLARSRAEPAYLTHHSTLVSHCDSSTEIRDHPRHGHFRQVNNLPGSSPYIGDCPVTRVLSLEEWTLDSGPLLSPLWVWGNSSLDSLECRDS